ncbi:receptor-like protein EIX2 [Prosopis cineraria]|uniref:receptor-like protein EIX2 n=1 Tax=Prosopis cineraria TaxID=364024 RepID=UPI0024109004|nr:receptor-like protein EIX2 [Prosopis cineraria]XP_054800067.1 receptor-like protein EIX2 [Prosopis cineraria]XP_054800068.1 receptor-like protein EIX2 [Prosopis cineraria]
MMMMMMDVRLVVASMVLLGHMSSMAFAVRCKESERLSLLALKQSFVDRDGKLSSWSDAENQTECCNWDGVFCDEESGHVDELYLSSYNLEGTIIPPGLTKLYHLKSLDLSGIHFNLTQFPSSILSLKKLEYLDLSDVNLTMKIPYQLGDLSSLQQLSLNGNHLEGSIPKSLALCSLEELDLSNNSLSGQIDDFVASFSHCADVSLVILDLSNNQFSWPLPKFSQISSLQDVDVSHNRLIGTLNDDIGLLSNLEHFDVGYNSVGGVISETHFSRLSQLYYLDFSFNHLIFKISPHWTPPFHAGHIGLASCELGPGFPMWLQTQILCDEIDISNAGISGTVPSWFWNLSFIRLNLSHNQIIGEIPYFSRPEGKLLYMDLSSNLFRGSIPSFLSYLLEGLDLSYNKITDATSFLCPSTTTNISLIDLSNNQLSGVLPDCWEYFDSLVFLSVANNSISGKIPTSMGSLKEIQALHLDNNKFIGEIPLTLNKCKELRTLDVAQNELTGLIPTWIGGLKKLRFLIMRSNMFFGSLPYNICHLSQLQILDISLNSVSGSLPKCLNLLSTLANEKNHVATVSYYFDYFDEGDDVMQNYYSTKDSASLVWKGKESMYQSILGLVKSIDLSSNMLTGDIPSEMMDLVGLVSLNLSRNMIRGQIPAAIGKLKSLDFLDLSRNHLSGNIPSELSHLDRLGVMDLSYNNLSGEIPIGTQLQSFDPSCYAENAGLCGAPLPKCPQKPTEDNQTDKSSEEDETFFDGGFFISLSVGFIMGFWGVCSLIFFNKSFRYAYFGLMGGIYDKVYALVAINVARLRRSNRASS